MNAPAPTELLIRQLREIATEFAIGNKTDCKQHVCWIAADRLRQAASVGVESYKCRAQCKAACAWPDCLCDPAVARIIADLVDKGWTAPDQAPQCEVQIEEVVCPNCHDANSCGDYQGPTCEVCNGTGRAAQAVPDSCRHAFRAADDIDWSHLDQFIPHSGHGQFWRAVFKEVRAALSVPSAQSNTLTGKDK